MPMLCNPMICTLSINLAMAASTQLAVARLCLVQSPIAPEAQNYGHRGFGVKLRLRNGICSALPEAKSSNDSPKTAELKLAEDPKKKGLVATWFNEYTAWPEVHRVLTERNVKSVECQEAYDLAQSGAAVLIDIREGQDYEAVHAKGAFSAPLFQLIQGNDFKSNVRRFGYALMTQFAGTERNPNFINQALEAVDGDKERSVVVICDIGGTLSTIVERKGPKAKKFADPERRFGRPSRSLRAVFELSEAGFKNVSFMNGGLNSWIHKDLPTEGS